MPVAATCAVVPEIVLVMVSPSWSYTVNSVEAATELLWLTTMLALVGSTTGAVSAPVALIDTQAPYWMPSLARS